MRVLPTPKPEVRVAVELTGQELQLIERGLQHVAAPGNDVLADAEVALLTEVQRVLNDQDLDALDK